MDLQFLYCISFHGADLFTLYWFTGLFLSVKCIDVVQVFIIIFFTVLFSHLHICFQHWFLHCIATYSIYFILQGWVATAGLEPCSPRSWATALTIQQQISFIRKTAYYSSYTIMNNSTDNVYSSPLLLWFSTVVIWLLRSSEVVLFYFHRSYLAAVILHSNNLTTVIFYSNATLL